MKEIPGIYYGADFRTSAGAPETSGTGVVVDRLGKSDDYTAAVVDPSGEVVKDDASHFQRLCVTDLGSQGVKVLRDINDNPVVPPGQEMSVYIGPHEVTIVGTATEGVTLNGEPATALDAETREKRYPSHTKSE